MSHHDPNTLRLEVETPPDGLPNLVPNPSGAKGAWGYLTPVASTVVEITALLECLQFTTYAAQAAHWTTDYLPLAATKYVAARFDAVAATTGHNVKCRFEFYGTAKTLISSSAQSVAFPGDFTTKYVTNAQAPAGTAYVKLRFDFYNGTGAPLANSFYAFNNVMVTWADTSAGLGSTRTNLVTNPSFEVNTTGWTATEPGAGAAPTLARVTTPTPPRGTGALRATANTADSIHVLTNVFTVAGGKDYTASVDVRAATTTRSFYLRFRWWRANGTELPYTQRNLGPDTNTGWTRKSYTATAPAGATTAKVVAIWTYPAIGEQHYLDAALVEAGTVVGAYFDGASTATGNTYAWAGTAHASTSTETSGLTTYPFTEPNGWRNILGPTHDLAIDRRGLDVGLLSATILEPLLDPSIETSLRPGRKVRVRALTDTEEWASLFEGKVTNAEVTYIPKTRITITASDAVAQLANRAESRGVASIAALPFLLEDKGVPWNVNGSGAQVTAQSTVAKNDNATMLDQIAIARDSALGYAWVNREGVVTVFDAAQMPTTPLATLDEATYSAADVGFNTANLINEVTVKYLRYNAAKGETAEIAYGPYRDTASITEWGPFSVEVTVQAFTESPSAIAAHAQSILTANAVPEVRVNTIRIPIRSEADVTASKALLDLYDLVTVANAAAATTETARVTGISHRITPEKWLVELGFTTDTAVASPTATPSPPPPNVGSNAPQAGTETVTTVASSWVSKAVTFPTAFLTTPTVVANYAPAGNPSGTVEIRAAAGSATTTGFTLWIWRNAAASTTVGWIAVAP